MTSRFKVQSRSFMILNCHYKKILKLFSSCLMLPYIYHFKDISVSQYTDYFLD